MTNQSTFPNALSADQFKDMFPDDEACAEDLFRRRWSAGFVCPDCGSQNAVRLKRKRCVHQCRDCRKQTSVAAGSFMHRSHMPLRTWCRALHIMTSRSNGMSTLQLQRHMGLGRYKSAWMLVHKISRAMDVAGRVSAGRDHAGGRDERSLSPQGFRAAQRAQWVLRKHPLQLRLPRPDLRTRLRPTLVDELRRARTRNLPYRHPGPQYFLEHLMDR